MRDDVLHALKLTTSLVKVRNEDSLLSDKYPCIACEDIETISEYKLRLIFGLHLNYVTDYSGFTDVEQKARDMFIVFKAWAHYNLDRIFTSLEIKHLYRYLARYISDLTFYKLLEALLLVDPF